MQTIEIRARRALALAAALPICAQPAGAQSLNSISSTIDEVRKRPAPEAVSEPSPADFVFLSTRQAEADNFGLTLIASSSINYDTNPARADGGSRDAARFRQILVANGFAKVGDVTFTAEADLVNDNFSNSKDNDLTILPLTFKATYGSTDKLSAYASYAPTFVFADFLSNRILTAHDLSIGVQHQFVLQGTAAAPNSALLLDLNYTRRFATIAEFEEHRPYLSAELAQKLSPRATLVLGSKVTVRSFTSGANVHRNDINFEGKAGLAWKPAPAAKLEMTAKFEKNSSDKDGSDYSVWDIGPALTAFVSF